MSVDGTLDTAFTTLLGKVGRSGSGAGAPIQTPGGTVYVPSTGSGVTSVNITFSGGGIPLVVPVGGAMPGSVEIPGSLSLVWVHVFAGDENGLPVAVTAAISLRLTSEGSFGTSAAIYGGTMPGLTAASNADIDISGWTQDFTTGDAILYRLDSFSGDATWLTLTMQMRPNATTVAT